MVQHGNEPSGATQVTVLLGHPEITGVFQKRVGSVEIFIYIKINYSSKLKLCTIERSFPSSDDANRATLCDHKNPSLS
jgi:hypothetical protein